MKYQTIKEALKKQVIETIIRDNRWGSDYRVFRKEYSNIIKEMIYEKETKEAIINRTIDAAALEIRKKAMPVIFEKLAGGEEK